MLKKALLPILLILAIIALLAAMDRWGEMGINERGTGWERFFPPGHHH